MPKEDSESPGQRLGAFARARRKQLELTQKQVAAAAKLGLSTIQSIERGEVDDPELATRRGLEAALQWVDKSASRLLTGGQPTPLEHVLTSEAELARLTVAQEEFLRLKGEGRTEEAAAAQLDLQSAMQAYAEARAAEDALAMQYRRVTHSRGPVGGTGEGAHDPQGAGTGGKILSVSERTVVLEGLVAIQVAVAAMVAALKPADDPEET